MAALEDLELTFSNSSITPANYRAAISENDLKHSRRDFPNLKI